MTGIDDWDRAALAVLAEKVEARIPELVDAVGLDQFDARMARAWVRDAEARGLVQREGRLGEPRYVITTKGRARLERLPPGSPETGGLAGG